MYSNKQIILHYLIIIIEGILYYTGRSKIIGNYTYYIINTRVSICPIYSYNICVTRNRDHSVYYRAI